MFAHHYSHGAAVGIGATTSIFSFVDTVLLRPLAYPQPDRLAIIWSGLGYSNRAPFSSYALFQMRQRTNEFDQVGGIWVTNSTLPGEEQAEQIKAGAVTSNFLPLLCARPKAIDSIPCGVAAALRFRSGDHRPVRSLRYFDRACGRRPAGKFPVAFSKRCERTGQWGRVLCHPGKCVRSGGPAFLHLVGRLRAGANVARAQAEANGIARQINALAVRQALSKFRIHVFSFHDDEVRSVRRSLLILFGGVPLVLPQSLVNFADVNVDARALAFTFGAA